MQYPLLFKNNFFWGLGGSLLKRSMGIDDGDSSTVPGRRQPHQHTLVSVGEESQIKFVHLSNGMCCLVPVCVADIGVVSSNDTGLSKLPEVYMDNRNFKENTMLR